MQFFFSGGLVQRCIIIHRDENGYGLTVSGDNPVYVQSVKPGECEQFYYYCHYFEINIDYVLKNQDTNLGT